MAAALFADTNLFVYARDTRDPAKHRRAREWVEFLWETRRGRVSRQVLQEYYVTVTQKLRPGMPPAEARADVRALFHWMEPIAADALIEAAWSFQDRASLSFWDALVVAAADRLGCSHVISEDLPAAQDLGGIRVIDPFEVAPSDIGD